LPYRIATDGHADVMLITSRETRRWVLPKGNLIKGLDWHQAAAQEAFEEAGINGIPCPTAIGEYRYAKRRKDGTTRDVSVAVFPLAFLDQAAEWPEQDERETRWFGLREAARAIDEPVLAQLVGGFRAPPPPPGLAERMIPAVQAEARKRIPMLGWFHALLPKQGRFFELFDAHAATLVAGAEALALLLRGGDDIETHIREIVRREHEADTITRDVLLDVRKIFVTPFDRSAITGLIGVMDDTIDAMNRVAALVTLYEISTFPQAMRDISGIIVEAARVTKEAISLLRSLAPNAARLHELTARLVQLEGHSDELYAVGLKTAFKEANGDAMGFFIQRELFGALEHAVDRFEDVANEIQGLVIDHA
jgi:predicted phosphate transport protein (TIGR00153 family)